MKKVKVFRLRYSRRPCPGPTIGYSGPEGEEVFLNYPILKLLPDGFEWCDEEGNFQKDDFLLEEAIEAIVSKGFRILSIIGPMPMWRSTKETSYQIIAQKREE
ncbi:MAG: hypothetical protein PHH21_01720 [Candidatus Pacebacteria bacterium]|nr:hypothetical protein [Candidatus Paceibacterota bacterium]